MATQKEMIEELLEKIEVLERRVSALESGNEKVAVALPEINQCANDLSSKERHRRTGALKRLRSMMHHKDARDTLVSALNSEHFDVLTQALDVLGSRKYEPALDTVIELLEFSEEPAIRQRAAAFLRRVPNEKAVPVLVKSLDDDNEHVVSEVVQALEEVGTEDALNKLEEWRLKS